VGKLFSLNFSLDEPYLLAAGGDKGQHCPELAVMYYYYYYCC
jgi:hypothetical protein